MSSDCNLPRKLNCRRSPRLGFSNIDLKNVTVRTRRKETPLSVLKKSYRKNLRESDDTYFENPFGKSEESSDITSDDSDPKKRCVGVSFMKVNSNYSMTNNQAGSLRSSTKIGQSNHSKSNKCYRNASKCLFNNQLDTVEKCRSCGELDGPLTVIADVHCDNSKKASESMLLKSVPNSRESDISDVESSSCFQPPYSSTRVFKTPNCSLSPKQNLQLSGVKELNNSFPNKGHDEINSYPIEVKNIPSTSQILPTVAPFSPNRPTPDENNDDDDDLPCTQPVITILLRDVVAFVDVKIGNLQISDSLKQQLTSMGAEVENKFSKRVTHVIFKDGNLSTYKKAKRWKIPLVSVMWINDCATSLSCLPINKYIPSGLDKYEARVVNTVEKDLFNIHKKPKVYSSTKIRKVRQEAKRLEKLNEYERQVNPNFEADAAPVTPQHEMPRRFNLIEEFINNLDGEVRDMINRSDTPPSSEDIHIPVPLSLLRMCITPRKAKTDVKQLPVKAPYVPTISGRRKNLDNFLLPKNNNPANINPLDKENVDSSEDYSGERKSAPSELITNYKHVSKRNFKKKKCNNNEPPKETNIDKDNLISDNNGIGSQQLTQTSRKRQLLPLDLPCNDLITETLNNSHESIEVINPYESPKRKSRKIASTFKKPTKFKTMRPVLKKIDEVRDHDTVSHSQENSDFFKRNSSVFFATRSTAKKRTMIKPTIVCTGFSKEYLDTIYSIVGQLGKYTIEDKVSEKTTHVIVKNDHFRTINLLKGISRGCWIVTIDWIYASCEAEKWISEEQFEITSFSPAVRLNRLDRQAFGPEYTFELFKDCGPIFVNKKCKPPSEDIKELISLSGGRIVGVARAASILIGGRPSMISKVLRISEKWVLDCITKGKLLDHKEYVTPSLRFS